MKNFYIQISTYETETPNIIDEATLEQAERGENYLNPDDFTFLCEAENASAANEFYFDEISRAFFERYAEANHP